MAMAREVEVGVRWWRVDGSPSEVVCADEGYRGLDACEQARADRLVDTRVRARWVRARYGLRAVLGTVLQVEPESLAWVEEAGGRPRVRGLGGTSFDFSHAHAGSWAAVAWSRTARVGLDVEDPERVVDLSLLARRALTPNEHAGWQGLPEAERRDAMVQVWLRKEAWGKLVGEGLRRDPRWFRVDVVGGVASMVALREGEALRVAWREGLGVRTWDAPAPTCLMTTAPEARVDAHVVSFGRGGGQSMTLG